MAPSIQAASKLCDRKQNKTANKDKPITAWQVVHTKTGKTLRHINIAAKKIDFLECEWSSLSAFAWVRKEGNVTPHFAEQGAKDMMRLYKLQTGDADVKIVRVLVA